MLVLMADQFQIFLSSKCPTHNSNFANMATNYFLVQPSFKIDQATRTSILSNILLLSKIALLLGLTIDKNCVSYLL